MEYNKYLEAVENRSKKLNLNKARFIYFEIGHEVELFLIGIPEILNIRQLKINYCMPLMQMNKDMYFQKILLQEDKE
jgi:hypothetical protein